MKTAPFIVLNAWLLGMSAGAVIAQQLGLPAVPITAEVRVHDPDGHPVEGATVHLGLPRYMEGERDQRSTAVTNREGIATVSGTAQQDYLLSAEKAGFYPTQGPHHGIDTEKEFAQYAVGVQKVELELRPVRNPVQRPISRTMDGLRLPAFQKPLGFDLEIGDWTAPYGKGNTADFIFTVEGHFRSVRDYDQILTLSFSKADDGIQARKYPKNIGPALKFPYEAPESGYEPRRVWRKTSDGKTRSSNFDVSGEANYIFRVRTELDENGRVRRALYGIIQGEILLGGNNEIGRNVSFTYALNPDWTANIEFDPATVLASPH